MLFSLGTQAIVCSFSYRATDVYSPMAIKTMEINPAFPCILTDAAIDKATNSIIY